MHNKDKLFCNCANVSTYIMWSGRVASMVCCWTIEYYWTKQGICVYIGKRFAYKQKI